jgi:hypothetical protein
MKRRRIYTLTPARLAMAMNLPAGMTLVSVALDAGPLGSLCASCFKLEVDSPDFDEVPEGGLIPSHPWPPGREVRPRPPEWNCETVLLVTDSLAEAQRFAESISGKEVRTPDGGVGVVNQAIVEENRDLLRHRIKGGPSFRVTARLLAELGPVRMEHPSTTDFAANYRGILASVVESNPDDDVQPDVVTEARP